MKAIWKFEVPITDRAVISMPKNAEIISFQTQYDRPCIWAIVDHGVEYENRFFKILGTGHSFDKAPGKFIGTAQMLNGNLVWHLFEIGEG